MQTQKRPTAPGGRRRKESESLYKLRRELYRLASPPLTLLASLQNLTFCVCFRDEARWPLVSLRLRSSFSLPTGTRRARRTHIPGTPSFSLPLSHYDSHSPMMISLSFSLTVSPLSRYISHFSYDVYFLAVFLLQCLLSRSIPLTMSPFSRHLSDYLLLSLCPLSHSIPLSLSFLSAVSVSLSLLSHSINSQYVSIEESVSLSLFLLFRSSSCSLSPLSIFFSRSCSISLPISFCHTVCPFPLSLSLRSPLFSPNI